MYHKFKLLFLTITSFLIFINFAHAKKFPNGYPECWQDPSNRIILNPKSPDQFCPLNSKLGHRFFLIDFTSPLEKAQIDWISGRIFGDTLVKETPPYYKVSYMKIDNTAPQSQIISYSKCRFKTGNKSKFDGEQTNTGCEGENQIKEAFKAWSALTRNFETDFLTLSNEEGKRSLIFEYLFHVLRESKVDFTSEYPDRELIIVSDLMQASKRFSFYRHCKSNFELKKPDKCRSFDKLLKNEKIKNYINDRKPSEDSLSNLKITILYINHDYETKDGLSSSLVKLWEDLFNHIGITNYEIIKQLDIE